MEEDRDGGQGGEKREPNPSAQNRAAMRCPTGDESRTAQECHPQKSRRKREDREQCGERGERGAAVAREHDGDQREARHHPLFERRAPQVAVKRVVTGVVRTDQHREQSNREHGRKYAAQWKRMVGMRRGSRVHKTAPGEIDAREQHDAEKKQRRQTHRRLRDSGECEHEEHGIGDEYERGIEAPRARFEIPFGHAALK